MQEKLIRDADLQHYYTDPDNSKVVTIWENLLSKLTKKYRKEAEIKGFTLVLYSEDMLSRNFLIKVPNASVELTNHLLELHPFVICLKD